MRNTVGVCWAINIRFTVIVCIMWANQFVGSGLVGLAAFRVYGVMSLNLALFVCSAALTMITHNEVFFKTFDQACMVKRSVTTMLRNMFGKGPSNVYMAAHAGVAVQPNKGEYFAEAHPHRPAADDAENDLQHSVALYSNDATWTSERLIAFCCLL